MQRSPSNIWPALQSLLGLRISLARHQETVLTARLYNYPTPCRAGLAVLCRSPFVIQALLGLSLSLPLVSSPLKLVDHRVSIIGARTSSGEPVEGLWVWMTKA